MDKYEKQELLKPYRELHNLFIGNSRLNNEDSLETLLTTYQMLESYLKGYPYKVKSLFTHNMYCIDVFTFKGAVIKRNETYKELEEKYLIKIPKLIDELHKSVEKITSQKAINEYLISQYSGHDKMFKLQDWLECSLRMYLDEYIHEELFGYKASHFVNFYVEEKPQLEKVVEFRMSFEPFTVLHKLSGYMDSTRAFIELDEKLKEEWLSKTTSVDTMWALDTQNRYEFVVGRGVVKL